MTITQDDLIKDIATKEDIDVATVRKVFKSAENTIYDYLSSIAPTEQLLIKIFTGLHINRKYIRKKIYSKGMFKNIESPEHVNVSGTVTKYFKTKVNDSLF